MKEIFYGLKDFSLGRKFDKKQKNVHEVSFDPFQMSFLLSIFAEVNNLGNEPKTWT